MVNQIQVNSDQVIIGRGGSALVASKSEPGAWHSVRAGQCDCIGFSKRGRCRHIQAVATAASQPAAVNPTFALYAATLAGDFSGFRQREEWNLSEVAAGETVALAEWRERRAS